MRTAIPGARRPFSLVPSLRSKLAEACASRTHRRRENRRPPVLKTGRITGPHALPKMRLKSECSDWTVSMRNKQGRELSRPLSDRLIGSRSELFARQVPVCDVEISPTCGALLRVRLCDRSRHDHRVHLPASLPAWRTRLHRRSAWHRLHAVAHRCCGPAITGSTAGRESYASDR